MAEVAGGGAPTGVTAVQEPAPPAQPDSSEGGLSTRSVWLLVVCCVAQFMVILDLSIVNVALPSIQDSLSFSQADLQWVVDGYAIAFAGFLMLGGRAADHFGQRKTFVVALAVFSLASLAGGIAGSREMLIAARIAQGLGGALMAASSLAIVTSSFPPGPQLHRAIGLWAAMNGLGGAAGTLFGGIITQEISWRWVLLINPPIGVAAAIVAFAVVKDRRRAPGAKFDLGGALLLTIGQIVLVYGIVEGGVFGWTSGRAVIPIVIGLAMLASFGVVESRLASQPLIPFKELTKPLNVANGIVLLFSAALFPMWFVGSLYLQQVLGLSPLHTGLVFLPMALTIMVCARSAGKLVSNFGVRPVLGGGLIMMTVGMVLFARIGASGSAIGYILVPGVLTAAGIGFSIVPSTIAATQGAKQGQTGLASGLVNTSRQVGGGLGLAILITLATERTTHLIGANHAVPQSLTEGFRLAYWIAAGLTGAAAVMTFALVQRGDGASVMRGMRVGIGVAIAVAVVAVVNVVLTESPGSPIGAYTTKGAYTFVSEPTLHPPQVLADDVGQASKLSPGYILMANFYDLTQHPITGQSGPLMLDQSLDPVWFRPVPEDVAASNLSLQRFEGQPVLAWWQGLVTNTGATESGTYYVVNKHYQTVAKLSGKDGWILTLHEIVIDGDNAWVTANKDIPANLSKYGGAYNGALTDSAVQEYNLKTGKLLRTWDALNHIPLSQSIASLPSNGFPWDAYHVNAIDVTGNGTFLVSMRNTWAVYLVNIYNGKIEWTLGGKNSSFKFGRGADFEWQHDAALQPGNVVTLFDDHCCQISSGGTYVSPTAPSRGLVLKLNKSTMTATVQNQYSKGPGFDADYMGDTQPLANGNVMVGWGSQPNISEYTKDGTLLLDAVLPHPDLTYRAKLEPWVGVPLYPPKGAARQKNGKTTVYASWNGSTQVTSWKVLAGSSAGALSAVATKSKSGFETAIAVPQGSSTYEVQALNSAGRVIGTSQPFG
jgi:EmrB/QacA subfamily drug resistance transporter